ncbi:MAG TPA: c-type cytochrome [Pyrinomonadaceae bacterium]|nr:c-type cytochrome [Pyrinomonadaceae bacterium]
MKSISTLKLTIIALFAVAALVVTFAASSNSASAAASIPSSPRTLYLNNCARCHGNDGRSQTKLGRKYDADDISGGVGTAKTIRIITNGKGHMPSFRKKLTAAQIEQIAHYVHSL